MRWGVREEEKEWETRESREQGAKMAGLDRRKEKLGKGRAAQRLERLRVGSWYASQDDSVTGTWE